MYGGSRSRFPAVWKTDSSCRYLAKMNRRRIGELPMCRYVIPPMLIIVLVMTLIAG